MSLSIYEVAGYTRQFGPVLSKVCARGALVSRRLHDMEVLPTWQIWVDLSWEKLIVWRRQPRVPAHRRRTRQQP
eukprot:5736806-Amphidinium_carterae.1